MTNCATYDDVNLVLRLYEMRREERLREARAWFVASFHAKTMEELNETCPPGSDENASFRMVVTYWDMVASFITGGVLQQDLFFQSGRELLVVWERLRDLLPAYRESRADSTAFENIAKVAKSYGEWMNERSPGSYDAFSKRIRGG